VRCQAGNGELRIGEFTSATLYNGAEHDLAIRLNDAEMKVWLDNVELVVTAAVTGGAASGYTLEFIVMGEPGTAVGDVVADFGELTVFNRAITVDEIAELAAGFSAMLQDPLPLRHYRAMLGDDGIDSIGEVNWQIGLQIAEHPDIVEPAEADDEHRADMRGHYELYLKPGSPADPNVDMPVLRLPRAARTANAIAFPYVPNTTHWASVWARNEVGRALTGPATAFPVDGGGNPVVTPAAVTEVTAVPTAGGRVLVGRRYDEPNTIAVAARFEIEAVAIDVVGQAPVTLEVTHTQPQIAYSAQIGPMLDGLWYVRVRSIAAGGARREQVSGVFVRPDSTPPVTSAVALEAV